MRVPQLDDMRGLYRELYQRLEKIDGGQADIGQAVINAALGAPRAPRIEAPGKGRGGRRQASAKRSSTRRW
eukprot:359763-Chlamydomonas_euryale.AAC.1